MPRRTARANARKSAVRSAVEHVFARQKGPMGLFIRTIGLARARTKIGLTNLTYNMQRMVWPAQTHQPDPKIRYHSRPRPGAPIALTKPVTAQPRCPALPFQDAR